MLNTYLYELLFLIGARIFLHIFLLTAYNIPPNINKKVEGRGIQEQILCL